VPLTAKSETTRFLELLEQRIALLGSLASTLVAARTDVVSFDLDGLEARIAEQERLCVEIRSLDAHIDQVQSQCATQLGTAANDSSLAAAKFDQAQMRDTFARLQEVQARVKQLNNAHQILLRRSHRTVSALLNSYHSFATTYSDPSTASTCVPAVVGERA
jgi:hypothetical protein